MRVRLSSDIELASSRAVSGVSPWTWVRISSRSAFWRRMRSTRTLPTASRINLNPGPASTGCCCWVSPREDDLRPMTLGELENMMRLAGGEHPRFIDDNGGVLGNLDTAPRGEAQQLVDAERPRLHVVAERHSRAPSHGGGDDVAPMFTVEIGDRTQRCGLARSRRPFDDGPPAPRMR